MVDSFREALRQKLARGAFGPAAIPRARATSQGPSTALGAPIPQTRWGDTIGSVNSTAAPAVLDQGRQYQPGSPENPTAETERWRREAAAKGFFDALAASTFTAQSVAANAIPNDPNARQAGQIRTGTGPSLQGAFGGGVTPHTHEEAVQQGWRLVDVRPYDYGITGNRVATVFTWCDPNEEESCAHIFHWMTDDDAMAYRRGESGWGGRPGSVGGETPYGGVNDGR